MVVFLVPHSHDCRQSTLQLQAHELGGQGCSAPGKQLVSQRCSHRPSVSGCALSWLGLDRAVTECKVPEAGCSIAHAADVCQ